MATRSTSIAALNDAEASGKLPNLRDMALAVYDWATQPLTAQEVHRIICGYKEVQLDSVRPRMIELKRIGLIEEAGERECSVSHVNCIVWRRSNNAAILPAPTNRRFRVVNCQTCPMYWEGSDDLEPECRHPFAPAGITPAEGSGTPPVECPLNVRSLTLFR